MKPPAPPPTWPAVHAPAPDRLLEIVALAARISDDPYRHWEQVRYLQSPHLFSPEEHWFALKFKRGSNRIDLPLQAKNGKPLWLTLTPAIHALLRRIERLAAGPFAAESKPLDDSGQRFVIKSLMEEAIESSLLEGAVSTREDAAILLRSGSPATSKSQWMILNNYLAMRRLKELKNTPLTLAGLQDLHATLTRNTLDDSLLGHIQSPQEPRVNVVDERIGRVVFEPPSAHTLPAHLSRLLAFANVPREDLQIPEVVRAILVHYALAYAHPFADGNGRSARALFYRSLLQDGYWLAEYISISKYIRAAPADYYRAFLHVQTDADDVTYFVAQQLKVLEQALLDTHAYLDRKGTEIRAVERLASASKALNYRQKALLSHALKHPDAGYSVNSHRNSHGVTAKTAREDLERLRELGLLSCVRIKRQDLYSPVARLEAALKKA